MATFVISTVDGAGELVGVVHDVESGWVCHFEGPDDLVSALSGDHHPDPGPQRRDPDGLGPGYRVEGAAGREGSLTPAQLRITYLQAGGHTAA